MRVHNNLKPFPCTICEKAFTQKRSLKEHLLTHDTVRHYECRHCEKKFVQKNHLKYHLASQHAETSASEVRIKQKLSIYVGQVRHQCAVCNKLFPFPYQLRKHVAVHGSKSAERQLQCRQARLCSLTKWKPLTFTSGAACHGSRPRHFFRNMHQNARPKLRIG